MRVSGGARIHAGEAGVGGRSHLGFDQVPPLGALVLANRRADGSDRRIPGSSARGYACGVCLHCHEPCVLENSQVWLGQNLCSRGVRVQIKLGPAAGWVGK